MTTSTPRTTETIVGQVQAINARRSGIQINDEWLGVSQYHPIRLPAVGEFVEVEVERLGDRGTWIRRLGSGADDDAPTVHQPPLPTAPPPSPSPDSDAQNIRLAVLQAAAVYGAGACQVHEEFKSADVLKIADAWLRWVTEP